MSIPWIWSMKRSLTSVEILWLMATSLIDIAIRGTDKMLCPCPNRSEP